jgi:hypothetical protein
MHAELNAQLAFHLTGARSAAALEPVDARSFRPALFAAYRDLTALRYDFPLVLAENSVVPLSRLVDEALAGVTDERARVQALRREREIRARLAGGLGGRLSALWDLEPKLALDGELADCDPAFPRRLVLELWNQVHEARSRSLREEVERLVAPLSGILAADHAHSDEGRTPEALARSLAVRDDTFDTAALSRLLAKALPERRLAPARRNRIRSALAELESQRPHDFVFESCAAALRAFQERRPALIDLAKAMAIARLEAGGEYVEAVHDPVFSEFGETSVDAELVPAYVVRLNARDLQAPENACLAELLASGLPAKILVEHHDILDWSAVANAPAFGAQARALAGLALGFNEVFVVQSAASNLYQLRDRVLKALEYSGAALINVFCAPYLAAAAAMESRAFPAFSYDPTAAHGERFSLENNPQPERDWPLHPLAYEDGEHQRVTEETAFTLMDFVACDARYAEYFARVARGRADAEVPSIPMVDAQNRLHRVIVSEALAREARRCLDAWHGLQARAKPKPVVVEKPAPPPPPAAVPAVPEPERPAPASDAAYIETPRCTTCEECVKINSRMFVYDANKQAYIADAKAGTYRELVEAAESCQVSIIHPGKPLDPNEPGLAELVERARPFL